LPSLERRSSPHDLIGFERPPVGEVALTLQFPSDAIELDVLAGFLTAVRSEFPLTERQPTAPRMHEQFDVPQPQPGFEITLEPPNALPRTWLISSDGVRLIQLQTDRISLNWRRADDAVPYPRYATLRRDLGRYLKTLRRCFDETGRKMPPVDLTEVTYVNPIDAPGPSRGGGHPELAKIVNRVRPRPRKSFLPHAEDAQVQARWRIPGNDVGAGGRPVGRLYMTAAPGVRPPTGEPIYVMTLVGRVIPAGNDESAAWRALDTAHEWVVLGFKDLTTQDMHELWGLREKE